MGEFREVTVSAFLLLAAVAWLIIVPGLVLRGLFASLPGGDTSIRGDGYLTWAGALGVGLPLAGVVVSVLTRRRGWAWFFGICLVPVAIVAALKLAHDVRHRPPPSPEPRHCVERSGGGNECPGG
jgi:hypothetical protein